jgi:hypothetical protein
MLTHSDIKLSRHPRTGVRRLRAGTVKTLALANALDNGGLTIQLDFETAGIPPIDFRMSPWQAIDMYQYLCMPYDDFSWSRSAQGDLAAAPDGRTGLACGPEETIQLVIDRAGVPTFTVNFEDGAPIPAVEFTLPVSLALALMAGIEASAQEFRWIELLQAAAAEPHSSTTRH